MGLMWRNPGLIVPCKSAIAAATAEGSVVILSTSADDTVKLPGGASPTATPLLGLLWQAAHPTLDNQPVEVVTSGIFPGVAGASITHGDLLTSNGTDGTLKPIGSVTAGTNVCVVGVATNSANSGERVGVWIDPFVLQG